MAENYSDWSSIYLNWNNHNRVDHLEIVENESTEDRRLKRKTVETWNYAFYLLAQPPISGIDPYDISEPSNGYLEYTFM